MRLRLGALLTMLAVTAGCGDSTENDKGPSVSGESRTGTAASFRKETGALCIPFYEKAGALQLRLRLLRITDRSSPQEKRKGLKIVSQIQRLSKRFAADQSKVPLPAGGQARRDAEELVKSTHSFVQAQNRNFAFVSRVARSGGGAGVGDRRTLALIQQNLRARIQRQQQLVRRLKITKCLPPG